MKEKFQLVLVAVMVALAIAEVTCRIMGLNGQPRIDPAQFAAWRQSGTNAIYQASDDPTLVYEVRPNYTTDGTRWTESHGILQSSDVPIDKPDNEIRIAVIGDSIAAGLYVRTASGVLPFPNRLEEYLNTHAKRSRGRIRVLNFGADGYGTLQEARLLETKVLQFQPDLIILQYCFNDTSTSITPLTWYLRPTPSSSHLLGWLLSYIRAESVPNLALRHTPYAPNFGPISPVEQRYWEDLYDPESTTWARVEEGFLQISKSTKRDKIPVVVAVFPLLLPRNADRRIVNRFFQQVEELARRHKFYVVDLAKPYATIPVAALSDNAEDPYHPNAFGHRLAADFIAGYLLSHLLLPE